MFADVTPGSLVAVALAALLIGTVGVLLARLAWRRRFEREIREIVHTLEELRSGRTRHRAEVDPSSPLAVAADALGRLGHDLHHRFSQAESAAERWRALADAAVDTAIITTDTDGDIRSFSAGATALFGWDEDEVLSRPAAVIFEESAYKDLLPKLARRSLRKQGISTRSMLLRRDGTSFRAEIAVRQLVGAGQDTVGFMMVVRDITDQIRMEDELRKGEQLYRGLVEGLTETVVILREGRLVYANPAAEALFGRPARELVGTPLRDHVATADLLLVEDRLADLERRGEGSATLRCRLLTRAGQLESEVRIGVGSVLYEGQPALLLLVQDESAERRIEVELRRNESRLDAVLEATSDGILVLAEQAGHATVQMTNRGFADLFGLTTAQLLGATEDRLLELLRARGARGEGVATWIGSVVAGPARQSVAVEGADEGDLQVSVTPLVGADGERLGRVVACRDLTEQRRSERELQAHAEQLEHSKVELEGSHRQLNEVNAQLRTRGEELDQLNRELRRLDEMKSNLLGNVSHELQTPLVSIRGYTEMILKERLGPITEEQRKGLTLSLRNIDRLIAMIDNLMAFSRPDPGLGEVKLSRFSLRPLIDEAVELLGEKMRARRIDPREAVGAVEDLAIEADRDKVLQVFLNLVSNAIKYNRAGGRIQIEAARGRPGYATVRVRDTGVGIPQESLERIFERNFQVRREGGTPQGEGIGLAIVRDILRIHGCTIRAESREHEGAVFTFTLPLAEGGSASEPGVPQPEAESPDDPGAPAPGRPRLRIIRRYRSED